MQTQGVYSTTLTKYLIIERENKNNLEWKQILKLEDSQHVCSCSFLNEKCLMCICLSFFLFYHFLVIAFDSFRISADMDSVNPSKDLFLATVKRNK